MGNYRPNEAFPQVSCFTLVVNVANRSESVATALRKRLLKI